MTSGTSPTSTTVLGANQFPANAVRSPDSPGGAFTATAGAPGAYQDGNLDLATAALIQVLIPRIVQSKSAVTGSAGKMVAAQFNNKNIRRNSIVAVVAMGEVEGPNIALAVTDTNENTYIQAPQKGTQSTTLETAIFYATNIAADSSTPNTVTAAVSGSSSVNTGMGIEIYEIYGLIDFSPAALDQTAIGNNAGSTSVSTGAITPVVPNELVFMGIAVGAGVTITPGSGWMLDSGSLSPTGGNLITFGSQSILQSVMAPIIPQATLSGSTAWAACAASFKAVILPMEGSINVAQIGGQPVQLAASDGVVNLQEVALGLYAGSGAYNRWNNAAGTGDAQFATNSASVVGYNYNGSTWNYIRGNLDNVTIISATAVTTTQTSSDQTNFNADIVYIVVNVTTLTGTTPTLTPKLNGKGPVAGVYFQIGAAITAISATGTYVYLFSTGAGTAAGGITAAAAFPVPRTWNFVMTAGGTITNATYTVEMMSDV